MAHIVGLLLGAIVVIYIISKIIEWIFLKKIIKNQALITLASTSLVFIAIAFLWFSAQGNPYAQSFVFLFTYFFAALFLAAIRYRRAKKNDS